MKKFFEKIKNSSKKSKIVAVVLATAVCVTSVWHNIGDKPVEINAEAAVSEKSYMSYVIDRMIGGLQENFTILEIVPHESQGEFRYYIGDDAVEEGLEANQTLMEAYYKSKGHYIHWQTKTWEKTDIWEEMGSAFHNFGYEIIYYSETDRFEVESPKRFLNYVVPKYKEYLEDRIVLNTVAGNDLTEEHIKEADFIIISTGTHDENTIACYNSFTNPDIKTIADAQTIDLNVYSKSVAGDGTVTMNKVTNALDITYNTYEQVTDADGNVSYVSRDIKWDVAEKLLDYTINGKDLELSDGTVVKTAAPVIMDNKKFDNLNKDGNMYKYQLLFRMLDSELLEKILPHISKTYMEGVNAVNYVNSEELDTAVLSVDKNFTSSTSTSFNRDDIYTICGGNYNDYDMYKDANPPHGAFLTNDYWVYSGDSCLIPSNMTNIYFNGTSKDEAGFYERVGTGATVIDVMQFLLGAVDDPVIKYKSVKILEIQPCTVFDYDEYSEVRALAEKMLLDVDGTLKNEDGSAVYEPLSEANYNVDGANVCIHVDCISSSGFNGINTDILMEYDAVILGDNDDLLLKDSNGKTIYNDKNLNGYIYLAFGDLIETKTGISIYYPEDYIALGRNYTLNEYVLTTSKLWNDRATLSTHPDFSTYYRYDIFKNIYSMQAGLFNPLIYNGLTAGKYYVLKNTNVLADDASSTDEMLSDKAGNVRLSGNDITGLKADALKEYIDAGKLLILGEEIYNYTDASSTIYPTSNIAEVARYAIDKDATRIREKKIGSMLLYLRNRNPILEFEQIPTKVEHDADGNVNKFNDTGFDLPFKFTIDGRANTKYSIKIYVDKNNDGVFYEGVLDNDLDEEYRSEIVTTDANGDIGVNIIVPLSDDYNGLVSYKLVVTELNSSGAEEPYRAGITGYTAIQGSELKDVYVLQILPIPYKGKTIHLSMTTNPIDWRTGKADPFYNVEFNELIKKAADAIGYNIVINTVYTSEYEAWFKAQAYDDTSEESKKNTNHLKNYDMVVLGFSDLYCGDDISDDNGALKCLDDFIDAGKSVLFTHDTVSYSNTVNNVTYTENNKGNMSITKHGTNVWATSLSRMFRAKVGMDRYGITSAETLADLKNAPVDKNGNIVYGLQGVSNMLAYRHSVATDTTNTGVSYQSDYTTSKKYMLYPYITGDKSDYGTLINTTHVTKLNDGQVTMFPYAIDDDLEVAVTHAQWYQLDMDDPSIVVWYTLAGDTVNNGQFYQDTDKDAANNYYIYSKGNITYSGAGHSDMNSKEELKLFINTVIKAITAGNNPPEVHVVESSFGDGVYNVYSAPYASEYEFTFYGNDADLRPMLGKFQTAKVTWTNNSFVKADGTTVSFTSSDGTIKPDDVIVFYDAVKTLRRNEQVTIKINEAAIPNRTADGKAISATAKKELVAYLETLIEEEKEVGANFYIELTDFYGDKGEATVRLVQREPFELD